MTQVSGSFVLNKSDKIIVSVIVPVYNRQDIICRAVHSLLNQSFDWLFEIIVVDDGSSDSTIEVLQNIGDERIVILSQLNQGASAARLHGIKKAKGEYIAFLDSDDLAMPNYLSDLYNALMANPDVILAYARTADMEGNQFYKLTLPTPNENNILERPDIALLDFGCFTVSMNLMTSKKVALIASEGREHILAANDYDFCLRASKHGSFVFVDSFTIKVDRRDDGISNVKSFRQPYFATKSILDNFGADCKEDRLLDSAVRRRINLYWPTAFAQCLVNRKVSFAIDLLLIGLKYGTLKDWKMLYWALEHNVSAKKK